MFFLGFIIKYNNVETRYYYTQINKKSPHILLCEEIFYLLFQYKILVLLVIRLFKL